VSPELADALGAVEVWEGEDVEEFGLRDHEIKPWILA